MNHAQQARLIHIVMGFLHVYFKKQHILGLFYWLNHLVSLQHSHLKHVDLQMLTNSSLLFYALPASFCFQESFPIAYT